MIATDFDQPTAEKIIHFIMTHTSLAMYDYFTHYGFVDKDMTVEEWIEYENEMPRELYLSARTAIASHILDNMVEELLEHTDTPENQWKTDKGLTKV